MPIKTRVATNVALLAALSIVFTRVFGVMVPISGLMTLRLGFGEIPLMLSGILFGPLAGLVAGTAADILGFLINSHGGAFFPGFTLSAALTGLIPGVLLYRHRAGLGWREILAAVVITDLVTGVLLNTLWLTIIVEKGFLVLLPPRLISRAITLPIYVFVLHATYKAYAAYQGLTAKADTKA